GAAGRFEIVGQGKSTKIVFRAPNVDGLPFTAWLDFEREGTSVGAIRLEGRSVPIQEFNLPLDSLAADVNRLFSELRIIQQDRISPPEDFIDPNLLIFIDPETGNRELPEYEKFLAIFGTDLPARLAEFKRGILDGFRQVYA
ncbi:MAG: hypothetical protein N2544_16815, partial [Burkholderiales bacterium]|nr:hypothetical protein [Burkholderiales bacterium]